MLRLNAAAGDHPVPVSPETMEALVTAHQISEWTHGKFDVTFGALTDAGSSITIRTTPSRRPQRLPRACHSSITAAW